VHLRAFSKEPPTHLLRFLGFLLCSLTGVSVGTDRTLSNDVRYTKTIPEAQKRYLQILTAHYARKGKDYLNTNLAYETKNTSIKALPAPVPVKVVERKIGRSVFIVSSQFNDNKQKDIVSTVARLIQSENPVKPGA